MSRPTREEHERIRDDLAAYALGALPAAEERALESHLESCEACRARLQWLRPAVEVLPASVEQRQPPERLRERLLATVRAEAEGSPSSRARRERRTAEAGASREPWWRSLGALALRPAAGFAALLLIAVGIGGGYLLRGEEDPAAVESVPVEATGGVQASATLERHGDAATLLVNRLPKLGDDEVYEVWVRRGATMEPGALFVLRRDGTAEAAVPGPLDDADAVLVTQEPRGGSRRPTSPPVLEARL